jgi:hypothetical protein
MAEFLERIRFGERAMQGGIAVWGSECENMPLRCQQCLLKDRLADFFKQKGQAFSLAVATILLLTWPRLAFATLNAQSR